MRFRTAIADALHLPPLELMEGFYDPSYPRVNIPDYWKLPIPWSSLNIHPAVRDFLTHSDCEGNLSPEQCADIAEELEKLVEDVDFVYGENTLESFIGGLRRAASAGEPLEFY